jgi:hypothetical protein
VLPTAQLRSMEVVANDIFNGYREMYYEGGAVSVYFWDLDDSAFAACVLFKKGARPRSTPPPPPRPLPHSASPPLGVSPNARPSAHACGDVIRRAHPAADVETKIKGLNAGNWDAIHVIEVKPGQSGKAGYKLTSTVMLRVAVDHNVKGAGTGGLNLSGSLTRQRESTLTAADPSVRRADRRPPAAHARRLFAFSDPLARQSGAVARGEHGPPGRGDGEPDARRPADDLLWQDQDGGERAVQGGRRGRGDEEEAVADAAAGRDGQVMCGSALRPLPPPLTLLRHSWPGRTCGPAGLGAAHLSSAGAGPAGCWVLDDHTRRSAGQG